MSIDRRIKKHVHGKPQILRITCVPGLEAACHREILQLMPDSGETWEIQTEEGAIACRQIRYSAVQFLLPRLRTASRMFLQIGKQRCTEKHQFVSWLEGIDWDLYLPPRIKVVARSFKSKLYHEGMLTELLTKAVSPIESLATPDTPQLLCTIRRDAAVLELELAGRPLSQRDYKADLASLAPLKAHAAYSCIDHFHSLLGQRPDRRLLVPFAGSGTLGFEYALFANSAFPGHWRETYAIQQCPFFKEAAWEHYRPARPELKAVDVHFVERDPRQAEALEANCNSFAGPYRPHFQVSLGDVFDTSEVKFTMAMNPPYGDRLAADAAFFRRLTDWIHAMGSAGFALLPADDCVKLHFDHDICSFRTGGKITHMLMWKS